MAAANITEDLQKGMKSLIICSICQDIFDRPKLLGCQHSFCMPCLELYYVSQNEQRLVKLTNFPCPQCRKMVYLPSDGLPGLSDDRKAKEILEFVDKLNTTTKARADICDVCCYEKKQVDATHFCVQCSKYYCVKCKDHHEGSALFQGHSLMKISSTDVAALECQEHKDEIKYYCNSCSIAICTVCALGKHSKHDTCDMQDAIENKKVTIQKLCDNLKSHVEDFKSAGKKLQDVGADQEASFTQLKDSVRAHRVDMKHKLQEQEDMIMQQVDAWRNQNQRKVNRDAKQIQQQSQNISKLCESAERMLKPENFLELLSVQKSFLDNLEKMCHIKPSSTGCDSLKVPKFQPHDLVQMGNLDLELPTPEPPTPHGMEPSQKFRFPSVSSSSVQSPQVTISPAQTRQSVFTYEAPSGTQNMQSQSESTEPSAETTSILRPETNFMVRPETTSILRPVTHTRKQKAQRPESIPERRAGLAWAIQVKILNLLFSH